MNVTVLAQNIHCMLMCKYDEDFEFIYRGCCASFPSLHPLWLFWGWLELYWIEIICACLLFPIFFSIVILQLLAQSLIAHNRY